MLILYLGFLFSCSIWTCASVQGRTETASNAYLFYLIVIAVLGIICCMCLEKDNKNRTGIMMALVLSNVGASLAFRMSDNSIQEYLRDTLLMTIGFVIVYVAVRYTKVYQTRVINIICMIGILISLLGARLFGKPIYGSYLYFCGFLVFGTVLMGYPFVVAHFMSQPENKYRNGNVTHLSLNMMKLLLYTFALFVGCVICNEFGLLLVVGLAATVIFFMRCKNNATKLIYSMACLGGVVVACKSIPHINDRVLIWLNPVEAYRNAELAEKAESVLYLFRNFRRMGWWGNGIGNLSERIYPTLNTDHVIVTLINDYSIFVAVLIIIVGMLLVKYMFVGGAHMDTYDRYLNLCNALVVGLILTINVASSLGSFITAGIGFPWVSNGGSVNFMLTVLLAIHCGMVGRKVKTYVEI